MSNFYRYIFPILDALLRRSYDINILFGIVLGIFLGFFPLGTLQWFASAILFIFLRVNLLSLCWTLLLSITLASVLDPLWNSFGFRLLTERSDLYPLWGWMHHAPILPFTNFNNTTVLGATVTALLAAPVAALFYLFLRKSSEEHFQKFGTKQR